MTMTNPITPPTELIEEWWGDRPSGTSIARLATQAAQWGAAQKLEACCKWLEQLEPARDYLAAQLCAANPPSLKEQALEALQNMDYMNQFPNEHDYNTIRRALEALPND